MPLVDATPMYRWWIAVLAIAIATIGVYWNTLDNEFLTFDDRKYIYESELVTGDGGLTAIWGDFRTEEPELHYYPLTFTTFWIEHALVGLSPPDANLDEAAGHPAHPLYHWTQMILHAINVGLVLFALRALGVRFVPALFVAAFFALHPINVASVAWMAERKNLVSAVFLWLSLILYVYHRRHAVESSSYTKRKVPPLYLAAVIAFALALCAKGASAVLAPVLIVTDRLLDRRWSWRSVARAVPFFILGFIIADLISRQEASIAKAWSPINSGLRPFIAMSAVVHYVTKMLVPIRQAIIYPRWAESLLEPRYWISLVVVIGAIFVIRRYRRWLGDHWLWGLALFLLTVAPVLGLKHFAWMQSAFVSDHYLYYGAPGILLMIALFLEKACRGDSDSGWSSGGGIVVIVLSLAALAACGGRTVQQNRVWQNNVTLWVHNIRISPDAIIPRLNLGNYYFGQKEYEKAMEQYKEWTRAHPGFALAWRSRARAAYRLNRPEDALDYYQRAVAAAEKKNPRSWSIHTEYARYLQSLGRLEASLIEYEAILNKEPPNADTIEDSVQRLRRQLSTSEAPVRSEAEDTAKSER